MNHYADVYVRRLYHENSVILDDAGDRIESVDDALVYLHAKQDLTGLAIPGLVIEENHNASQP